jgi:hypothetical protein
MSREFCALCKVNYQVKLNHSSECPYCRIAELERDKEKLLEAVDSRDGFIKIQEAHLQALRDFLTIIYEKKKPWSMEDLAALLKEGDYYSPLPDWSCQC